jgi:hypothetical protein
MNSPRLAALACALVATAAWPCSLSGDVTDCRVLAVSPSMGATGVPTNAEVKVLANDLRKTLEFELRSGQTGEVLPHDVTVLADEKTFEGSDAPRVMRPYGRLVRLRPRAPFAPGDVITVRRTDRSAMGALVTAFTVGAPSDTQAPSAPSTLSSSFAATILDEPCSGTSFHAAWTMTTDGASDDQTPPEQLMYLATFSTKQPDGGDEARAVAWSPAWQTVGDTGRSNTLASEEPETLQLSVRAVDWSGNASEASAVTLSPGLSGLAPVRQVRKTCGCDATPASWVLWLALAGMALRRGRGRPPG